jgi:SHS2 domain-containing protein
MKKFETFPHTADIGLRVYGNDLKDLFVNSGEGILFLMREEKDIEEKETYNFKIESDYLEMLLYKFLNEFIYLFDSKNFIANRFIIEEFNEKEINGKIFGETFDPKRHKIKYAIKSCTLEDMKFEKIDSLYKVEIIFDI